MSRPRSRWQRVDGVLLLDKPSGITSNLALQKARRLFNAEKAGHTGTLDPMATGLLPLCFGEATKFSSELLDADKAYQAEVRLGITTDTADAEGAVLETRPVAVSRHQLEQTLARFLGPQQQLPPMHSALKRDGKPLYEYARAGIEVARTPRSIIIHDITLLEFSGERFTLDVDCSKGTYIRTLAADIGAALGCGAHLSALRRTRIGRLSVAEAVRLESLETMGSEQRQALLQAPDALLACTAEARLDAAAAARILHGQCVAWPGAAEETRVRLYGAKGEFLGLAVIRQGELAPKRLVAEKTAPSF